MDPVQTTTTPLRGTAETIVDADAPTLYQLVSDPTSYGRFSPENRSARWLGGASPDLLRPSARAARPPAGSEPHLRLSSGPVAGATFRSWNRRGWFQWFTHCRVLTADADREFAFQVIFPPPVTHTVWRYRLEALAADRTRLQESWELPRPLGPARRAMLRLVLGVRDRPASMTEGAAATVLAIRDHCAAADR